MSSRAQKILLLLLALVLFGGSGVVQSVLNREREELGITRVEPLENAPPVLAFTTVALGGFRGLIVNALWIRAMELQEEDKYFEMAQLADWITKLEPHFVQVWLVQGWNMAYNISVKFKDFDDRWRWVQHGISLLRDEGLRYNPNEVLIYRELAWFFQHKMGANLDDANITYKTAWADDMSTVFGNKQPNLDELINPATDDARARAKLLRETYKMDPAYMKELDAHYGPLEWRLPESSAIYWAALGLEKAKENPTKVNRQDLITLRRVVYQSMQLSFQRGKLTLNPFAGGFEFGPNLDIIKKTSDAYEQAIQEDTENADHIATAHRNFLRDAVYFLYEYHRLQEAADWYRYLGEKYPDKTVLDGDSNSFPSRVGMEEYSVRRIQEDISETSRDRVTAAVGGLIYNAYTSLIVDEEHATGLMLMAEKIHAIYTGKVPERGGAIALPEFGKMKQLTLDQLLNVTNGMPYAARTVLRRKLNMPEESASQNVDTNAPAASAFSPGVSTNAPATNAPAPRAPAR